MTGTGIVVDGSRLSYGNADDAGAFNSEWVTGAFYPKQTGLRCAPVQLKWSHRPAGWNRGRSSEAVCTSMALLVSGSMRYSFTGAAEDTVTLSRPGDYVMWGPGTRHDVTVLTDCTVCTLRWHDDIRGN